MPNPRRLARSAHAHASNGVWTGYAAASSFAATVDWSGEWSVVDRCTGGGCAGRDFPSTFVWTQTGGAISGTTPYVFTGTASGRSAHITGKGTGGYIAVFAITMSADGRRFTGSWTDNQSQSGTTTGSRAQPPQPPQLPPLPPANEPTGRMLDIKPTRKGLTASVTVIRDGVTYSGPVNSTLQKGDIITTGPDTLAAVEFLIGGRVGINADTQVVMVNERAVADGALSIKRTLLKNAALWVKADAKRLKEPIEIQTNGGILGIKD